MAQITKNGQMEKVLKGKVFPSHEIDAFSLREATGTQLNVGIS